MHFDFNLYSTPLLFGFVQGWIYAVLFWIRGWRHERLSDTLFGLLLVACTFDLWEYMLGFGGVEILWKELEFFPRNFSLLLPPLVWFYLKSQFNSDFRFQRSDLIHALPFVVSALYHILVFAQGPAFVASWKDTIHYPYGIVHLEALLILFVQVLYFYKTFRLYQQYRYWTPLQFSDTESVSFRWFRNFILAFLASGILGWSMTLIDMWLDLDFWHDWWDELFNAALIYYLSIAGYAQPQPRKLHFVSEMVVEPQLENRQEKISEAEMESWDYLLKQLMHTEKPYLEPELTIADLARRLQTNASILSTIINRVYGKNFNDFVNTYRVDAVKTMMKNPEAAHLSLLGIGLECGFNSKSTFNRAFKKATGVSPSEFA